MLILPVVEAALRTEARVELLLMAAHSISQRRLGTALAYMRFRAGPKGASLSHSSSARLHGSSDSQVYHTNTSAW